MAVETEEEQEAPFRLVTLSNNVLHSISSNVAVYINNQQIYNSNGLYALKFYISNNFKRAISEHKLVLHCEGYDYEQFRDEFTEAPSCEPFFRRRMKMLSRPDAFMFFGKLGVDFLSTSELLHRNMNFRLRLIRARLNSYMIGDKPIFILGIIDCSLFTRRIGLKDGYHKEKNDMLVYTPVGFNYTGTLAKTFIIPARQKHLIQENIINNAPVRRSAIAMNADSAFTESYTENPLKNEQFDLRQTKILKGAQPVFDFVAAEMSPLRYYNESIEPSR